MPVIALYNLKGGVGKTAAAVNLAALAASEGEPCLLWDLDLQAAATFHLHGREGLPVRGRAILSRRANLGDLPAETQVPRLDLLASDFSFRKLDTLLAEVDKPRKQLIQLLKPLRETYRYIFMDCPPVISLLAENIFRAADLILVPLVPTPLCLRAYEEIVVFFHRKRLPSRKILSFFSMVEGRKKLHRELMSLSREREPGMCTAIIPYSAEVEKPSHSGRPLVVRQSKSRAAESYRALWTDVQGYLASLEIKGPS